MNLFREIEEIENQYSPEELRHALPEKLTT
jgi:hypothetical protein